MDLVKAFDLVNHDFLLEVLYKFGIPEVTIDVICRMYKDFQLTFSVKKGPKIFLT